MRTDSLGMFWADEPPAPKEKLEKPKRTPPERTWLRPDYLPGLAEARTLDQYLMTDDELVAAAMAGDTLVFDIECYPNYFLAGFASHKTGKIRYFEATADKPLDVAGLSWVLQNFCTVGFNSISYDLPITALAVAGKSLQVLKNETEQIIVFEQRGQDVLRKHRVKKLQVNHIDLIEVAPLRASLKIYGGRLHTPHMQDLPFSPEQTLSEEQIAIVRWYCLKKDLTSTAFLLTALSEELALRVSLSSEYGVDLRSKSDAQIAETVIADEVSKLNGARVQRPVIAPGTSYNFKVPHFLQFQSPVMQWVLELVRNAVFVVGEDGAIGTPEQIKELQIQIAGATYTIGIGGLHSCEKQVAHYADSNTLLIDRDVTSYYPFIILNQGLYPLHLGPNFLRVYRSIVERRLEAKRRGDKVVANSLKITINGSYGKLGSMWSTLYSPDLLIQVTMTGQLSLLMLIERLELAGITVVSANTDGVCIKCPKVLESRMNEIVAQWERDTCFETEAVNYIALYSRDVNNYIAVKAGDKKNPEPTIKSKGAFALPGLQKNPTGTVCIDALEALLTKGVPIDHTIRACQDIRKFANVRTVKGGAVKIWEDNPVPAHKSKQELVALAGFTEVAKGTWRHPAAQGEMAGASLDDAYRQARHLWLADKQEYLGKAIRWYYAKDLPGEIVYASNGNKVPKSDGGRPMMDIPQVFPSDVDYDRYIADATDMLVDLGYASK